MLSLLILDPEPFRNSFGPKLEKNGKHCASAISEKKFANVNVNSFRSYIMLLQQ